MEGISKEDLDKKLDKIRNYNIPNEVVNSVLAACKELNPWQPIETAPKDRQVLLRNEFYKCTGQWNFDVNVWVDDGNRTMIATYRAELPEDPI